MAVYNEGDRVLKWRYTVDNIQIIIPDEDIITLPPQRLSRMSISNDYEKNVFPIFRINLQLESSTYYKIIKNKDKVQFYLRIQKYYYTSDKSYESLKRDYINDKFNLILDDNDPDLLYYMKQLQNKDDYKNIVQDDSNDLSKLNNVEFFLFKSTTIKNLKTNINIILQDATMTDAIGYIAATSKIKNLLMSPPNNTKIYDKIVIPPLTALDALKFLDSYYGLYKNGSIIYFDFKYSYILNYIGKCTAYVTGEKQNTDIIIPKPISNHSVEPCTLYKEKNSTNNSVVADYHSILIRNNSISNDILVSNSITMIDNYTGEIKKETSLAPNVNDKNTIRIEEDQTENQWIANTYVKQANASGVVINFVLSDYDADMIAPNKKINMVFEDSSLTADYNGTYILSSINHSFTKDGTDLVISSNATVKRG